MIIGSFADSDTGSSYDANSSIPPSAHR